jgi:hypothetical protein
MSFNTFKNVESFSDTQVSEQIEQNLSEFYNNGFLSIGAFSSVRLAQNDRTGLSKSNLTKIGDGKVWSAFKRNLVHEPIAGAISISGVYINNTLHLPTSSTYPHYVDYPNGQVVFQSGINASSVKMEFSYKNVNIETIDTNPWVKEFQYSAQDLDLITDFTLASGDFNRDRKRVVHLPLICNEIVRTSYLPMEIGNGANWNRLDMHTHVFAKSNTEVSKIIDILGKQKCKTIYYFDIDEVVRSGVYPLVYNGSKNTNALYYSDNAKAGFEGGYGQKEIYIKDCNGTMGEYKSNIHYGLVRIQLEIK